MKLKLIPILTRMHHDISTATQVEGLINSCIFPSPTLFLSTLQSPLSFLLFHLSSSSSSTSILTLPPHPSSSSFLLILPSHCPFSPPLTPLLFPTLPPHPISSPSLQVRDLCVKLLLSYPSLSFVTAILHTLTELAIATVVHMVDQVGGGYSDWFP